MDLEKIKRDVRQVTLELLEAAKLDPKDESLEEVAVRL